VVVDDVAADRGLGFGFGCDRWGGFRSCLVGSQRGAAGQ
jgi:hypothetical protein